MDIIKLSRGLTTRVDNDIADLYDGVAWHAKPHGQTFYARHCGRGGENVYLHRLILKPSDGYEVDHIDGDGLNNQRSNLRLVTHRSNMKNIHVEKSSSHHGVYYNRSCRKWQAYVYFKSRPLYLALFDSESDAAETQKFVYRILNLWA